MRFRTLEIRWHDSKPISTCDFQPTTFKKARPQPNGSDMNGMEWAEKWAEQKYRLATGGEDNHVRVRPAVACPPFKLSDFHADMDGTPQYTPCRPAFGVHNGAAETSTRGVPGHPQQALGCCQRRQMESQWCVALLAMFRRLIHLTFARRTYRVGWGRYVAVFSTAPSS